MSDVYRCYAPSYDPRLKLTLSPHGCRPTHWNSTEHPFRKSIPWVLGSSHFSDMARACFWPCASDLAVAHEPWIKDPWTVGCLLLGFSLVLISNSLSRARWVWIGLSCVFSVVFSVMIMGYATSKLWRNELSYSGVGTLTAVQVLVGFVLQKTWDWTEDHMHWVALYIFTFAVVGLAIGRGFVPEDVDPRASAALETIGVCVVCLVCFFAVLPSPTLAVMCSVIAIGLKFVLDSSRNNWGYEKLAEVTTRREVGKLMQSPEFQRWFEKNHMRLRLLR